MPHDAERRFLKLVRENEARLWKICRVHAGTAEARTELYQDMLVQLWRALPSFARGSSVSTWVYRVALNTALTHVRQESTARRRETPLDQHDHLETDASRPDERLDREQRLERLYAAINQLNAIDKMLVTMYLDERSYREMADVLGISESSVGVKLHRIRKQLAGQLAEERV
ncbi:MAG TPA: sigma-70 family RNA polymerase sigma factor [Gemmatimonadaceae bacterium]|nr:sigma-70 family RNA polymerase sigma factor [Gemmatimonadaceae bacterium]